MADDVEWFRRANNADNPIHVRPLLTSWPGETNPLKERSDEEEELSFSQSLTKTDPQTQGERKKSLRFEEMSIIIQEILWVKSVWMLPVLLVSQNIRQVNQYLSPLGNVVSS